jgi:hypothetical protein
MACTCVDENGEPRDLCFGTCSKADFIQIKKDEFDKQLKWFKEGVRFGIELGEEYKGF